MIPTTVTDEAVERAARAEWDHDFVHAPWEGAPDDVRDYYRDSARAALTDAAPLIAAQALKDAADAMAADPEFRDPLRLRADWLRARADEIAGEQR